MGELELTCASDPFIINVFVGLDGCCISSFMESDIIQTFIKVAKANLVENEDTFEYEALNALELLRRLSFSLQRRDCMRTSSWLSHAATGLICKAIERQGRTSSIFNSSGRLIACI